jgi:hypothetical protein
VPKASRHPYGIRPVSSARPQLSPPLRSLGDGAPAAEPGAPVDAQQDRIFRVPRWRRGARHDGEKTIIASTGVIPRDHPPLGMIAAYMAHGVGFLALAAAALVHFGLVFWVAALVIAAFSAISLREAWLLVEKYSASKRQ